jgi:ribosomal protein S18 acetylase RimI-like enzyme
MDSRIVRRLNEHILEAHRHFCQSVAGGAFERAGGWARGYTGSPVSTFNILLILNEQALTDDLLSDAAAYFEEQRVPHVVAFDEHWLPGGANFLHTRSYQPLPPMPGMVLLGPARRLRPHPDLAVERVKAERAMDVYGNLVSELFGLSRSDTAHLFPANQLKNKAIRHYVGYLDGVPAVVGSAVLAEGIVSVWNVATRDDVRRQGVATSLMEQLLEEAWADGCDVSLVYSSPMAYSLYQRLGYELYTQRFSFLPPEW